MKGPDTAELRRSIYRRTRPTSRPFISGDGFRRMAHQIYDGADSAAFAKRLQRGNIVFMATDLARRFFRDCAPHIEVPYTIVTHNSDVAVDEEMIALSGENLTHWFAQNNTHAHQNVIPIPIGLENLHHYRAGIPAAFSALRKKPRTKKNRMLVSFHVPTNKAERTRILDLAGQAAGADRLPEWLDQSTYLRTLSEYRFVVSPPGNGLDTHRTWEAMYLGVIPIVAASVAMRSFAALGLPIWILESWDELPRIREDEMAARYEEWRDRFSHPALYLEYWQRRVRESSLLGRKTQGPRSAAA